MVAHGTIKRPAERKSRALLGIAPEKVPVAELAREGCKAHAAEEFVGPEEGEQDNCIAYVLGRQDRGACCDEVLNAARIHRGIVCHKQLCKGGARGEREALPGEMVHRDVRCPEKEDGEDEP